MDRFTKDWLQRRQIGVYAVAVGLAIGVGVVIPDSGSTLERVLNPVLAALLYVTFLEIPFVRLRDAVREPRFLAAALGLNFLVVPVVAFGLTRILPPEPVLVIGALLVLLTPCIDYVITFTELAGGDSERVTAATPALMLVQLLLLPVYFRLFIGPEVAEFIAAGPFVEAFVFIIALPLTVAWGTEVAGERSAAGTRWQAAMGWLPVPLLGLTLFVVVASQLPRVLASVERIAAVVPVYVAFLVVMPLFGRVAAGILGFHAGMGRALVFTSVTRNSLVVLPLAVALPAGYELAPAVVVTQTLVELTGMVILTRVVPAWLIPDSFGAAPPTGPTG